MEFVRYVPDPAVEQEWLECEPSMALSDALILVPKGTALTKKAIEAIRHYRYYRNARDGFVMLSDTVAVFGKCGSVDTMLRMAEKEAWQATENMPDFQAHDMDDGCGLLFLSHAHVFAFRPFGLSIDSMLSMELALSVRQECLDACMDNTPIAVVYCNEKDYPGEA